MQRTHENAMRLQLIHRLNMARKRIARAKRGSKDMAYVPPKEWSRTPRRDPNKPHTKETSAIVKRILGLISKA